MNDSTTTVLRIDAMDCPTESELLRKEFEGMPGILTLKFDLLERRISLKHSLSGDEAIIQTIRKLGMAPVILAKDDGRQAAASTVTSVSSRRSVVLQVRDRPAGQSTGRQHRLRLRLWRQHERPLAS